MTQEDHDRWLYRNCVSIVVYPVLDTNSHRGGYRICLACPDDETEMSAFNSKDNSQEIGCGVKAFPYGYCTTYNVPFITLCHFFPWTRETSLDVQQCDRFLDTYGPIGFGSRSSSKCVGQNLYQGVRSGVVVSNTPSQGPGKAQLHQYYRQDAYKPCLMVLAEKTTNQLVRSSQNYMKWLCPASFRLLNHITPKADFEKNNNFCRVKVVTQGIPARYNRNEFLTLGFANTPHADVGDALDDKCQGDAEHVL